MTRRDFLRLPIGKYEMSDGISNYTLEKCISSYDKCTMYVIKIGQSFERVTLFEDKENVYEDNSKYTYPVLVGISGVGGINVHGRVSYSNLKKLKITPKSTYKQWIEKMESIKP